MPVLIVLLLLPCTAFALDYVAELGGQDHIERGVIFLITGLVGMLAHYFKQWERGEITGNLWQYLAKDKPMATVKAIMGFLWSAVMLYASGSLQGMTLIPLVTYGLTTGYAFDSVLNRSASATQPRST